MKGYVHLYTGNGKGKTTAAFGLSLRAAGAGKKIFFAQFVKGKIYSEIKAVKKFLPDITVKQYGLKCFIVDTPKAEDIEAAQRGLQEVEAVMASGKYDLIVLDEITIALFYKLVPLEELLRILKKRPENTELILTGRYAPRELIAFSDLVTEMREVKHYYTENVKAREGIEF